MEKSMPERFLCPISADLMTNPVMDVHGHNFQK